MSRKFVLERDVDETGVSGIGQVAEGIVFWDGTVVLRWRSKFPGTTMFSSSEDMQGVHGHGGKTRVVFIDEWIDRGRDDAAQDSMENAPFASVGGLGQRTNLQLPKYIPEEFRHEYLAGYAQQCRLMFGAGWMTCEFGWTPAITIGAT